MEIELLQDNDSIKTISDTITCGKPFYFYHLPGNSHCTFGKDVSVRNGIRPGGFVIASFDKSILLTLTPDGKCDNESDYYFPNPITHLTSPTSRSQHQLSVNTIVNRLRRNGEGKCVLSRLITGPLQYPIHTILATLVSKYPNAFVFCFHTPATGLWIGASPERLLTADSEGIHTMSLAGTRPSGTRDEWDEKNKEEQQIVSQSICDTLRHHGLSPLISHPFTKNAGPVEHICQTIDIHKNNLNDTQVADLLTDLSPTPALGGYPRHLALSLIKETEHHERECYGGFCGPYKDNSHFEIFVNLRSAKIFYNYNRYAQFVGGGITRFSHPDEEWEETTIKSHTLQL